MTTRIDPSKSKTIGNFTVLPSPSLPGPIGIIIESMILINRVRWVHMPGIHCRATKDVTNVASNIITGPSYRQEAFCLYPDADQADRKKSSQFGKPDTFRLAALEL